MRISTTDLINQYNRTNAQFPFIKEINSQYDLPACLLFAVASRETNMNNIRGDAGHGHGMFQLDDRYHQIPSGFDGDVRAQTVKAAEMLQGLIARYGSVLAACNAYNSGSPNTKDTAGHDYGPDVLERMVFLRDRGTDSGIPDMKYGDDNRNVKRLQEFMVRTFPAYNKYSPTGFYGDATAAGLAEFQTRVGIVGGDGRNVGPQTKSKLKDYGLVW